MGRNAVPSQTMLCTHLAVDKASTTPGVCVCVAILEVPIRTYFGRTSDTVG